MAGERKRRERSHVIADLSVNHVERQILRCWHSVERIEHDYGIDLLMFTYGESREIENGYVAFQLKATDELKVLARKQVIAYRVSMADLKYWMFEPMPVILVVYDAKRNRAFWIYVQHYLEQNPPDEAIDPQDSWTVHIPLAQRLNRYAIEKFRRFRSQVLSQVEGTIRHDDH